MFGNLFEVAIFAVIAWVILVRLYKVLGQKEDESSKDMLRKYLKEHIIQQEPPHSTAPKPVTVVNQPADILFPSEEAPPALLHADPKIAAAFAAIQARDKNFNEPQFTKGAKRAFEVIVQSFSKGDKDTLSKLVGKEALSSFISAIDAREQTGEYPDTTIVSILSSDIVDASVSEGHRAHITVKFISEQITVIRNKVGEIIAGNPSHIDKLQDIWMFGRSLNEPDSTWLLLSTKGVTS